MIEPEFLDLEDVLLIQEEQLAKYGGAAGVRDQGLLESALALPKTTFGGRFVHEDLFAMAAAAYASTSPRTSPSLMATSARACWPPSSSWS